MLLSFERGMLQMKINWPALVAVALVAASVVGYKLHIKRATFSGENRLPRVLLVADLSEADSADSCAEIIHSVRVAGARGISVEELNSDSKSEILRRYQILTIPTVLILDANGQVVSRFAGEDRQTVNAVRAQLDQLR